MTSQMTAFIAIRAKVNRTGNNCRERLRCLTPAWAWCLEPPGCGGVGLKAAANDHCFRREECRECCGLLRCTARNIILCPQIHCNMSSLQSVHWMNTLNMYNVSSSQVAVRIHHECCAALVLAQCADHHQINVRNFMNNLIIIKWCYCAGFITFTRWAPVSAPTARTASRSDTASKHGRAKTSTQKITTWMFKIAKPKLNAWS